MDSYNINIDLEPTPEAAAGEVVDIAAVTDLTTQLLAMVRDAGFNASSVTVTQFKEEFAEMVKEIRTVGEVTIDLEDDDHSGYGDA